MSYEDVQAFIRETDQIRSQFNYLTQQLDLINHSINEIAEMISDNTEYIPPRLGEARVTLAHISRIKGTLGWEPKIKLEDWIKSALPKEEIEETQNPIMKSLDKIRGWLYGE